jgi:hypothetical protein
MDHLDPLRMESDSGSGIGGDSPGPAGPAARRCPDEPTSAADIEECLKLLDEVWPGDEQRVEQPPRQLGRFAIVGELGRGGFGVVFLAEDSLLGRRAGP